MNRLMTFITVILSCFIIYGQDNVEKFNIGRTDTIYYDPSNPPDVFKGGVVYLKFLQGKPTNLSIAATADDSLTLTWTDGVTGETGFEIARSTDGTNFTVIDTVIANAISYLDTGLTHYTTYYYTVAGFNGANYTNKDTANQRTLYPFVLRTNTAGWYASGDLVTKDGSNAISSWGDKSGSNHPLLQTTGALQPIWSSDGITFDGLNSGNVDHMVASFTLNQPVTIYMVAKIISTNNSVNIIYTGANGGMHLYRYQALAAGKYIMYGGSTEVSTGIDINLNVFEVSVSEFNGTSSNFRLNATQGANKSIGTSAPGGICIGARQDGYSGCNFIVKEIIVRNKIEDAGNKDLIYNYLKVKYGL